jgi:uncharacterized protein with GYD domain
MRSSSNIQTRRQSDDGEPAGSVRQAAKLFESFGGKMENAYWFPTGGEYDGMVIVQVPDAVTEEAIQPYSENDGQLY